MSSIDKLNNSFDSMKFNPFLIVFIIGTAAGFEITIKNKNPGVKLIGILLSVVSLSTGIMILNLTN